MTTIKNSSCYILKNGNIVLPDTILYNHSILIKNGKISSVCSQLPVNAKTQYPIIDCSDYYILPGFIDIHNDSIEKLICPRPGVTLDSYIALQTIDQQLISCGITTVYHSTTVAKTTITNHKRTFSPQHVFDLCNLLYISKDNWKIRHKCHARLELNTTEVFDDIYRLIRENKIQELSFMDHTPGQGQYRNLSTFQRVITMHYGNVEKDQEEKIIEVCQNKSLLSKDKIENLISLCHEHNIPIALHDVENTYQLQWMKEKKIKICEFPLHFDIAEASVNRGVYTVVGAPNVLIGNSHNGNASATELIKNRVGTILCSDYYSPAILQSIAYLYHNNILELPEAVNLASLTPAKALGIDENLGSICPGKSADICIVNMKEAKPAVQAVFVEGQLQVAYSDFLLRLIKIGGR